MVSTRTFLTANWRYLAMLNYEIEPEILRPYVPYGTELDQWNGKTFVSMVGFLFLDTRLFGLPVPWHQNFEEVNLRFYVRRLGPAGWRRGVVFIKELVPKPAIAGVARLAYNENYQALPMRHTLERSASPHIFAEYGWRVNQAWNYLHVKTTGPLQAIVDGSEEEFIAEHYWGYAAQKDGGCVEYQVEHPRWRIWQVAESRLHCNVAALYGPQFVKCLASPPTSAFLAEGSTIIVRRGARVP
jgi:uncharacterized protein YqjF (DUF2071 family)